MFEKTGEFRPPLKGEYFETASGRPMQARRGRHINPRYILRPPAAKPTQPQLPDPKPGYEWYQQCTQPSRITYAQRPICKLYDWSKTGPNVLVVDALAGARFYDTATHPTSLVHGVWQAHIGGDPCPVDPDATMVEVRADGIITHAGKASADDWSYDCIWRVTGLVEGYSYDR